MKGAWARWLAAVCGLVVTVAALAPRAGAVVVHERNGHFAGVTPRRGVAPASIAGSVAAQNGSALATTGNLDYHDGPVMHSSAPYLIYWTPGGESIPATWRSLLERHFTDVAADSGRASNVYGIARQFTDHSGFADYQQTFSPSGQAIVDTQPYPAPDTTNCPDVSRTYPTCISDAQLQAEVQRLITADGLPADGSASATSLPQNAPIYFVVLPTDVNTCGLFGGGSPQCGDNSFCAYHSSFTDASNYNVVYAAIPTLVLGQGSGQNPKSCQFDNNSRVQEPNGNLADVVVKYLNHEDNETITDPLGNAWWNTSSGQENGDNCNQYGSFSPSTGANPNAFLPVLGGSATAGTLSGTLYNQLINGDQYYIQSEWSNGDTNCEMTPSAGTIGPQFTEPAGPNLAGTSLSFNPGASTSTNPYTSATWNFGDGTAPIFRTSSETATVSHTFTAVGRYTISYTLVDDRGNVATATRQIAIGSPPTAAFTYAPSQPLQGAAASFDGTGSSDPDSGVVITSYSWDFGDNSTGTGAATTHTYAGYGTYTVKLTVTNSIGLTITTSHQVIVHALPSAAFTLSPTPVLERTAVSFNGAASSDPESGTAIVSYAWDFGDGARATGAGGSHAYTGPGTYTVRLTVTNNLGLTSTASHQVAVTDELPTAALVIKTARRVNGQPVSFDGSSSRDPDGPITSYAWSFGDGSRGTGSTPRHTYKNPGAYTVSLSVTDSSGASATAFSTISIPLAGRATKVSVRSSGSGATLLISVNEAGVVSAGRKTARMGRAGTARFSIRLTAAQLRKIGGGRSIKVRIPLRFAPLAGPQWTRTVTIMFRPSRHDPRRFAALLEGRVTSG